MNARWAEDNLQVIRTLMENTAIYRRALGPIMVTTGVFGIAASAVGIMLHLEQGELAVYWISIACVVLVSALLQSRRQALKDNEPFWSLPTRRVAQALVPPLFVGFVLTLLVVTADAIPSEAVCVFIWLFFYGGALHAAGFLAPVGLRHLGWLFWGTAVLVVIGLSSLPWGNYVTLAVICHAIMGATFGLFHLIYGVYLLLNKERVSAA